jgi:hypothetical protein
MALILLIAVNACKKDGIAYGGDYGRSYLAWQEFKSATGNSYTYQVATSSWTGYSSETTITIKQGKIVERTYAAKLMMSSPPVMREWKEDENQLGTHDEGAALQTLDDIYAKAKSDWLLKRDDAKAFFETKNDGMISSCGYVPNGCQDDCFTGIRIKYIRGL